MSKSGLLRITRVATAGLLAVVLLGACLSPESGLGRHKADNHARMPRNVTFVVPYDVGGGTDTWARFMAPHLSKNLARQPSIVTENVPGGESITGTNQFVNGAGTDGRRVLISSGTTYFQYLLERKEAEFDFSKMRPLVVNGASGVIYASKASGVRSLGDLKDPPKKLVYGGISATGLDMSTLLVFELLGIDVKTTFGFEGRGPAHLALQRGEVNLDYQTTSAYRTQVEPMVKKGTAVPLMSFGVMKSDGTIGRDPNFPKVPTVQEAYERLHGKKPSGEAYRAYMAFYGAGFTYQKAIWGNQGTPDALADSYSRAANKLEHDAKFKRDGEEVLGGYDVYSGNDLRVGVRRAFNIKDSERRFVLKMLEDKYDTKVPTKN